MIRKSLRLGLVSALTVASVVTLALPAAAESGGMFGNFFNWLGESHRDRYAPVNAYTDPAANPEQRLQPAPITPSVSGNAYCVRLCDGRYFPISSPAASSRAEATKVCAGMCPASKTAIYRGGDIDNAAGSGGERYAELPNAFVFRKRVVADCTCNGHDAFGLAPVDIATDTSLQAGDIVATGAGLTVFKGSRGDIHRTAEFTPIRPAPTLSADTRRTLTGMKVSRSD